jgi:hypothetical protein
LKDFDGEAVKFIMISKELKLSFAHAWLKLVYNPHCFEPKAVVATINNKTSK